MVKLASSDSERYIALTLPLLLTTYLPDNKSRNASHVHHRRQRKAVSSVPSSSHVQSLIGSIYTLKVSSSLPLARASSILLPGLSTGGLGLGHRKAEIMGGWEQGMIEDDRGIEEEERREEKRRAETRWTKL